MQQYILALTITPLFFSIILPFNSIRVRNISTYLLVALKEELQDGIVHRENMAQRVANDKED